MADDVVPFKGMDLTRPTTATALNNLKARFKENEEVLRAVLGEKEYEVMVRRCTDDNEGGAPESDQELEAGPQGHESYTEPAMVS